VQKIVFQQPVRDRDGRKHQPKRWLVFGQRMADFAAVLQERGIKGEIQNLRKWCLTQREAV